MTPKPVMMPKLVLALAALFLFGCAVIPRQSPGDKLLASGNLRRAAVEYERSLGGAPSARQEEAALYGLAVIYAAPGETFDPMHSRLMIERLLERFPRTRYRTQVMVLGALHDEVARLETAVEAARQQVAAWSRNADGCHQRSAELDDEVGLLFQMSAEEAASRRACEQALAALRRRVAEREKEIGRLHDAVAALEALKRIDTERKPGG